MVVERVRAMPQERTLRLLSTNPGHPDVSRDARDCHIIGKVLCKVARV